MKKFSLTIIMVLITACSTRPHAVKTIPDDNALKSHSIYIVSHGYHTGIIIPSDVINASLPLLARRFEKTRYYEIGWGDKKYYEAEKANWRLGLRALFWPTDTVVHVVAITKSPDIYFANSTVIETKISRNELQSLTKFISDSFHRDFYGLLVESKQGLYGDSQFYQGSGSFHFFNTCNKWTAKGLKSAGMDISHTLKLTADSIIKFLKEKQQNKTDK